MERAQVIALAVIVAALALFGIGYVVDGQRPAGARLTSSPARSVTAPAPASASRIARPSRAAARRAPGRAVSRPSSGAAGAAVRPTTTARSAVAEVIAGARRGASGLGRSGSSVRRRRDRRQRHLRRPAGGALRHPTARRQQRRQRRGPAASSEPSRSKSRRPTSSRSTSRPACCCRFRSRAASTPSRAAARPRRTGWWWTATASSSPIRRSTRCPPRATSTAPPGSIAFDIQPHWDGGDETNNSLLQIRDEHEWANDLQIVKNLDSLRFIIIDSSRRRAGRQHLHQRLAGGPVAPDHRHLGRGADDALRRR